MRAARYFVFNMLLATLLIILGLSVPGCSILQSLGLAPASTPTTRPVSATDRVYHARQIHTEAMKTLTGLINDGFITNKATLKMIKDANAEVGTDLDLAEQHALDPDRSIFNDVMDRVNANLDKLQQEASKKRAEIIQPPEEFPWSIQQQSSSSAVLSFAVSRTSASWSRSNSRSPVANL